MTTTDQTIYRGMIAGDSWLVRRQRRDGALGHCRMCGARVYWRNGGGAVRCQHEPGCEVAGAAQPGEAGTDAATA